MTTPAIANADTGCPTAAIAYASGNGTAGSPFVISTPAQLQKWRSTSADQSPNKYVSLGADIDMGGCQWSGMVDWFTGTFDGQGHVISGVNIVVSGVTDVGFFGAIGANTTVEDVGFTGAVTAQYPAGGAYVTVGGLVGLVASASATVRRSFATGNVSGSSNASATGIIDVGGLVGASNGTVADSWASGNVTATTTGSGVSWAHAGGLIGSAQGTGPVSRTLARGTAQATATGAGSREQFAGALVGMRGTNTPVTASFWKSDGWPAGHNGAGFRGPAGTGKTAAGLQAFATYGPSGGAWSITNGFSDASTWSICAAHAGGYPFISAFAATGVCPAPPLEPTPDPTPGSSGETVSSPGTVTPLIGTIAPSAPPSAPAPSRTTLGVTMQARASVPIGRRSTLIDGVRTSGAITGVGAWCEWRGVRLPARHARTLCGIQVHRGTASSAREAAARAIRVTARPRCSTGLVLRVRVSARASNARRATWARSWRVSASPSVACRLAPKLAIAG